MKDKANNSLKTPQVPTNRREGLKLGTASLMTSLLPISSLLAAQTESPPKEGHGRQHIYSPVSLRGLTSGPCGFAPPCKRHEMARTGTGVRCNSGRAARNNSKARAILGDAA